VVVVVVVVGGGVVVGSVVVVVVGGVVDTVVGVGLGRTVVVCGAVVSTRDGAVGVTTGGGGGVGDGGGGGGTVLGTGSALGGGGADGGGGTGLGAIELTGGAGGGAMLGTVGASRFSTPVKVYATPPIAVIATAEDSPMTSCDSRNRRRRALGGSTMFRRIDQGEGPSSS
jgi:hypothetical protein